MNDFKSTFSLGQKIAKQYYILARLEAADILSRLTTTIIGIIIALILIIITIVYLSISLCYFVDTFIGNMAISALIIAAFNLLLCIIVFLFRNFNNPSHLHQDTLPQRKSQHKHKIGKIQS